MTTQTGSDMISQLGGLFAIMTLAHFAFDWLTQREQDAIRKQYDWRVRFFHCFIYSVLMTITFVVITDVHFMWAWLIFQWLFITHFIEDTYWFPLWWMENVRKTKAGVYEGFNAVLVVTADQVVHLACLLVACWLAL